MARTKTKTKTKDVSEAIAAAPNRLGWQAEKSAIMRRQILQAALTCIVNNGYNETTMAKIAKEAGVSSGAMVHHFSNKGQLIAAVIDHLSEQRIADFRHRFDNLPPGVDRGRQGLELYWEHLTDPRFSAFYELLLGARTDEELRHLVIPAIRKFEEQWYATISDLFPEWHSAGPLFDLAMDLSQFLNEGMVLHMLVDPSPERYRRLRRYLNHRLNELLEISNRPDAAEAAQRYLEGKPV